MEFLKQCWVTVAHNTLHRSLLSSQKHITSSTLPAVLSFHRVTDKLNIPWRLWRTHALRKSTDPHMVLLTCCSTQFKWCNLSPAELLIGRRLRTNISLVRDQLVPDWKFLEKSQHCNQDFKNKQKYDYDHRHRTQPLGIIPDNSDVVDHNWQPTNPRPSCVIFKHTPIIPG